jgi:hypothetical protein
MVSRSGTDPPRVSAQRVMGRRSASARTAASWSRSRSRRGVVLYWSRKASAQASGSCRSSTGQVSERCSPRLRSRLLDFAYRADAAFSPPQLLRARRDSPGRLRRRSRIHGERHSERKPAGALQSREGGSRAFARASAAPASFRQCARPDRELARADVLPMHRMPRAQPSGALAHRPRQSSRQRGLGRLLLHANGSSGHVRELSFSDPSLPIRCRIRSRAEDVIQAGLSGPRAFSYL